MRIRKKGAARGWSGTRSDQARFVSKNNRLDAIAQTVRLIRSKGVGIFFVTQSPKDVPADVLAQLGNRVQHALRAFTPDDAKALKATLGILERAVLRGYPRPLAVR